MKPFLKIFIIIFILTANVWAYLDEESKGLFEKDLNYNSRNQIQKRFRRNYI